MKVHWLIMFVTGLILTVLSAGFHVRTERQNSEQKFSSRAARVQLQSIEQAALILRRMDAVSDIHRFNDSIGTLQIQVSQKLEAIEWHQPVGIESFEQSLLSSSFMSPYGQLVQKLRLSVSISAPHFLALLDGLDSFSDSLEPWPSDTRSCDVGRSVEHQLMAQCVIDIYHWTSET